MTRSAGLAVYLASRTLAGAPKAKRNQSLDEPPPRPDGELVWFHAGLGTRPEAVRELARRFTRLRRGSSAVLTGGSDFSDLAPPMWIGAEPDENKREINKFYDHWRPDAVLLTGEVDRPGAMMAAYDRNVPLFLVEARIPAASIRPLRWAPGVGTSLFQKVAHILTPTEADADVFRRLRAPAPRVEARGLLEEGTAPLPCNLSDHAALALLLAARPVWLASCIDALEIDGVIAAHRRATRIAHRLLLIVVPAEPSLGPMLRDTLKDGGWKVALRSDGDEPDPEVQVFIADVPNEAGLWYRLAPITFLGRSLVRGGPGNDPCEPAALGSAILAGPDMGRHRQTFQRFLAAGAARTVGSAEALGEAVADLLSPDRAAEMSRRAWEVTSQGAELTDRVLELLVTALDERDSP
jgi:3-deoxy-D-manno-octulosonic-acid transferase